MSSGRARISRTVDPASGEPGPKSAPVGGADSTARSSGIDSGARPTRPPLPPRGDALLPLLPAPAPPLMPPAPRVGEDGRDDGPAPQADALLRPPLKICNGHICDLLGQPLELVGAMSGLPSPLPGTQVVKFDKKETVVGHEISKPPSLSLPLTRWDPGNRLDSPVQKHWSLRHRNGRIVLHSRAPNSVLWGR